MKRLINSFRFAFAGIGYLVRTQPNMPNATWLSRRWW